MKPSLILVLLFLVLLFGSVAESGSESPYQSSPQKKNLVLSNDRAIEGIAENPQKHQVRPQSKVNGAAVVESPKPEQAAKNAGNTFTAAGVPCSLGDHCDDDWDDDIDGAQGGTSEFRINTGFNIGLHWRPIRTKQKIKKVLFYLPKKAARTSKHLLGKLIIKKKGAKVENGGEKDEYGDESGYDSDYHYNEEHHDNYDYDGYDSDEYDENYYYSCDESGDYESYGGDVKAHRVKVHSVSLHNKPSNAKTSKASHRLHKKERPALLPQSLEFHGSSGTMTAPTEGFGGQQGREAGTNKSANNYDVADAGSTSAKAEEDAHVGPVAESSKETTKVYDRADETSSSSIGEDDIGLSVLNNEPEYVLISTSILVNEICEHMPNHFRSDDQQEGKSEEILLVVFKEPETSGNTTKIQNPRVERHVFYPGKPIFSASSRASIGLYGYLLFAILAAMVA